MEAERHVKRHVARLGHVKTLMEVVNTRRITELVGGDTTDPEK
jgi:hypothetical protein